MDGVVLHDRLAAAPWMDPALWRLPGMKPLHLDDWLIRDEAFAGQMALRDDLIVNRQSLVHAIRPEAESGARECLDLVLAALASDPGYRIGNGTVRRPDGIEVDLDRDTPLLTLGRLLQADVCVMTSGPAGHVLSGAILCFPASWTLAEKIGRPLTAIHTPVPEYDSDVAGRVQRLFDAIRPERPLWRANAILHHDPTLFHPRREADPPALRHGAPGGRFLRSERQTLRRLPQSDAVIFTIHTTVIPVDRLTGEQKSSLADTSLKSG
ncbi:MAG: DUF3445 domain-containing protein [Silicimonas sp.]|nr:DUF3445 domain-containing protein [Silicimonas sp.]